KDTYKAEVSSEEAKKIVDETCLKYFEGYTLQEARGAWTDGKNNLTHEYTLVCYFDDADINMVHKAADELITKLNQNSILIEKDRIEMEFYSNSHESPPLTKLTTRGKRSSSLAPFGLPRIPQCVAKRLLRPATRLCQAGRRAG
ncbi:MAG: hypothetical protein J6S63_08000, partial [Atopobiaceae bacterium]|nr:hypothetical protein [Atopobiaceae bacterium]